MKWQNIKKKRLKLNSPGLDLGLQCILIFIINWFSLFFSYYLIFRKLWLDIDILADSAYLLMDELIFKTHLSLALPIQWLIILTELFNLVDHSRNMGWFKMSSLSACQCIFPIRYVRQHVCSLNIHYKSTFTCYECIFQIHESVIITLTAHLWL